MCSGNGNICIRWTAEDAAEAETVNGEQSNPFPIQMAYISVSTTFAAQPIGLCPVFII